MKFKINFRHLLLILSHPRVFIFIIIGTAIMFLTFLTDDNALEIAISGMASIFIGIGVNNLTSIETRMKDGRKIQSKIGHSLKIMQVTKSRISRLCNETEIETGRKIKDELAELNQFIDIGIQLMKEDTFLE